MKTKMKDVKCNNPKTYNITKGKEYRVLNDGKKSYTIINDRGLQASYDARLFTDVKKELTDKEIINSVIVNEDGTVSFSNREEQTVTIDTGLEVARAGISCGINQIINLNNFSDTVSNLINPLGFEEDLATRLKEICFQKAFISSALSREALFTQASTNENHGNYEMISNALSELASHMNSGMNPNSNNDISFWLFVNEDFANTDADLEEVK